MPFKSLYTHISDSCLLHNIQQNTKHMQYTSEKHKEMKNRMHISFLFQQVIEQCSYCVANPSCYQKSRSACRKHPYGGAPCKYYAPTHNQITHCRKFSKCLYVNGIKSDSKHGNSPDYSEQAPAEHRLVFPQRSQGNWRVCACNQKKNRAMVYYLENLFCHQLRL